MAVKKSHVDLLNDVENQYEVDGPIKIHRSVFWGDNMSLGRNVIPAGSHVKAHSHPEEQYSLVVSGECDVRCGDEKFHLGPGCICFAPSNADHELWMWDESDVVIYDFFVPVRQDWIDPLDEK